MNPIEHIKERGEFSELHLEHLVEKTRVNQKRKTDRRHRKKTLPKKTHWANRVSACRKNRDWSDHDGTYSDTEPSGKQRFWHGRKPVRPNNAIHNYSQLTAAITAISLGDKNHVEYRGVAGINRERLRLAQSWSDRGRQYKSSHILALNLSEIKKELGFSKPHYGRVLSHNNKSI